MPINWEPGPDMRRWQTRITRLLGEGMQQLNEWSQGWHAAPVNVLETERCLEAVFAMPAMHKDEIEVTFSGDTLTVRSDAKYDTSQDQRYVRREWGYGPYQRSLTLSGPVDVDNATASYDNGVLTVVMPKRREAPVPQPAAADEA
ncbi:MAG: Hsp20/alpha crystallin family protein [Candidatus Sericytochromatia bacterium]|nr:Hsp20/alpha crystallin family protein [Candidatus Sericytochromatia bacterium]